MVASPTSNRVGEVLDRYPDLLDTFLAFGFTPLANPVLRRTLARYVTIAQACRRLQVAAPRRTGHDADNTALGQPR